MAKTHCDVCDRNFKNEESLEMHKKAKHSESKDKGEKSKKISKKSKSLIWYVIAGIVGVIILFLIFSSVSGGGKYDDFAQCLTDSGIKMYGAYWCPHCQEQKALFGRSWKKVNYVECSLPNAAGKTEICISEGIESYPTWEFQDGSRKGGVVPLTELSRESGCALVENY